MLDNTSNDLWGLRKNLLLIAYDLLCIRSELASLTMEDMDRDEHSNCGRIKLHKNKADQNNLGTLLLIGNESSIALAN